MVRKSARYSARSEKVISWEQNMDKEQNTGEIDALRDEKERYRKALERIAKLSSGGNRHLDDYGDIAREALK
jgi:hypothetical protein